MIWVGNYSILWHDRTNDGSAQVCEQTFHLRSRVLVACADGCLNSLFQDGLCVGGAIVLRKGLRVHLVARHVVGIGFDQRLKMFLSGGQVAFPDARERNAVTREGIVGIPGEEIFELLPAGFVLFCHGDVSYYTFSP